MTTMRHLPLIIVLLIGCGQEPSPPWVARQKEAEAAQLKYEAELARLQQIEGEFQAGLKRLDAELTASARERVAFEKTAKSLPIAEYTAETNRRDKSHADLARQRAELSAKTRAALTAQIAIVNAAAESALAGGITQTIGIVEQAGPQRAP